MPIYAYRCTTCGHAQDVLRKISDPPLNVCPACGAATFAKQVTAAGFQLKGSGWYVTDFRDKEGRQAREATTLARLRRERPQRTAMRSPRTAAPRATESRDARRAPREERGGACCRAGRGRGRRLPTRARA